MRRDYIQQKGYQIVEKWECEWWSLYKTDASVKRHLRENFPYRLPLSEEQLLQGIINGQLFGYVQRDIGVPEHLRSYFLNFPPIFKNTVVSREDIGTLMRDYAENENIMPQPRKMLISSFNLTNGSIITPLLLFFLQHGLVCRFTGLFNTLPESALTISYSLPWMHDVKELKTQIPVLSLRL